MEEIDLADMSFDFDDYFGRFRSGDMSEEEKEEFAARVIGVFCRGVFRSKGDPANIPFWAANYVAEQLYKVLGGLPWANAFHLPFWYPPEHPFLSKQGERAMHIYAEVENARKTRDEFNVTSLLAEQAAKLCVSYETARADYYAIKKVIVMKQEWPIKFLKQNAEN